MRTALVLVAAAFLASVAPARAADPELKTDEEKALYALGLALSQNIGQFNVKESEVPFVIAGMTDGLLKKDRKVDLNAFGPKLQEFARTRAAAAAEIEKKAGDEYLAKAAAEKGAKKTDSGLVFISTVEGSGESPKAADKVKVHYTGTLTDGSVFDSSVQRGEPATFPLNGVIKCWTEGVQMMKVGGKAKLVCPARIAYGDQGSPPKIKPGATLVFEVELLEIVK
jgi:FKBP-type peptidyl-prolyl cis-trans isomerase FkpA/FKBP-type peptidyl-prolyl cis-trans isomerase FklB